MQQVVLGEAEHFGPFQVHVIRAHFGHVHLNDLVTVWGGGGVWGHEGVKVVRVRATRTSGTLSPF